MCSVKQSSFLTVKSSERNAELEEDVAGKFIIVSIISNLYGMLTIENLSSETTLVLHIIVLKVDLCFFFFWETA